MQGKSNIDRRGFLNLGLCSSAAILVSCGRDERVNSSSSDQDDWLQATKIKRDTRLPDIPKNTFDLSDFSDLVEGQDWTKAFEASISACSKAGGGRVRIPRGLYLTGPIHLQSNLNLHLEKGAVIKFVSDPQRYLPAVFTRWEGVELMGYSPLIYARGQSNIAITGEGVIDGGADKSTWWPWKGHHTRANWEINSAQTQQAARDALFRDAENGLPVENRIYAENAFLRPPLIQTYECQNVLVDGVTLKDSPFWLLHPVLCKNVTVSHVTFSSHGPNSDGCNPESCDHVVIHNCLFDTGDDCIAIKSGRNADGRRINTPSQNIVISDCKMKAGHGGVVIGSEISGGVNHVFVENCQMDSPDLERAIRIKTNSVRGGVIEHLRYRNITVGVVRSGIVINFFYEEGDAGDYDPLVRDIVISNLTIANVIKRPFNIQGFPRQPIQDLHLANCKFINADHGDSIVQNVTNVSLDKVFVGFEQIDQDNFLTQAEKRF
jgi:polygalacturonase